MLSSDKPLYSQIIEILRDRIEDGQYVPDQQLPTELELAEQFGVSRITSKRALIELEREGLIYRRRGSGSFVKRKEVPVRKPETKVERQSHRIVSMIIPYDMSNNTLSYIPGLTANLEQKGYYLSIHNSDWSSEKERELLLSLPMRGTSGIILYPVSTQRNLELVHRLHMNQYPIVTIDQYYSDLSVGSVVSDNFEGGYMAASKLIELGHTRIAFLSTIAIQYRSSVRDRFFGYCKALRDNGILVDNELIFSYMPEQAERDLALRRDYYKSLLERMRELQVTAIQAEHDLVAQECIKAAVELGTRLPDDLSIIGFDNNRSIGLQAEVPITTIEQNYMEIGNQAAELIVSQMESFRLDIGRLKIPISWVPRNSVGPGPDYQNLND